MNERYYAILGRSYLGLTNASTLLSTSHRLDGRRIILIGQESPWHRYENHEMGQPACFLALPGFVASPANPRALEPLESREFSRILRAQEKYLIEQGVKVEDTRVKSIKKISGEPTYGLELSSGRSVKVEKIDFCIGASLSRVLERSEIEAPLSILQDWVSSAWRNAPSTCTPLATADQFLSAPARKIRVVGVVGAGGVAQQCVDLAIQRGAEKVYWVDQPRSTSTPQYRPDRIRPTALRKRIDENAARIHNLIGQPAVFHLADGCVRISASSSSHVVDLLIVARGAIGRAAAIPTEWFDLKPEGTLFVEDLAQEWKLDFPLESAAGLKDWRYGLRDRDDTIRALVPPNQPSESSLDYLDYLRSLWNELPLDPRAPQPLPDKRLIAVQAASLAVANRYQPVDGRILNANTAFLDELQQRMPDTTPTLAERVRQPLVDHLDPQVQCWYCC